MYMERGKVNHKLEHAEGVDFVRPPMLDMKKVNETKDYKEYEVTTFKTPKDRFSTNPSDESYVFTSVTDSLIFCNETMKIQLPKKSFMKRKDGTYKFAYAFGMFPYPKTGKAAYLDGCILGALGLKRQQVQADVVCFVTPDISFKDRMKLAVVFDKVIRVPYISPYEMPDDGIDELKTIRMDPEIFANCNKYTKLHPYTHVFFKLHIFNPDLFPYEKVCFVDSDLVPMNYYDSLFMLNTPAGWVEYRKKIPYKESYGWDRCDFLKHGEKIPHIFTDVDTPGGADVNAGLMVISPSKREYNSMIKEISSPLKSWMGPTKYHKGFYDFDFDSPIGSKFVANSYCYPEQNYLTKRYSGKWTFIEFAFQSWSLDPCNSFGIHMAAFNPKPWFKQPIGSEISLTSRPRQYYKKRDDELWINRELPKAVMKHDPSKNYQNITISYELFNDVVIWGMVNYRDLTEFFMGETKICGKKISFDEDNFDKVTSKQPHILFKDIVKNSSIYKRLSVSQKYICNLIQDYEGFVDTVKDKYLSICKTVLKDRYGNYVGNYAIITYPDFIDISENERNHLLLHDKMPIGRFKGIKINELDPEFAKQFVKYRVFEMNKDFRDAFRRSKFKNLVQSESSYPKLGAPSRAGVNKKTRKKRTKARVKNRVKAKRTKRKQSTLYYFYMDNCSACNQFKPMWSRLKQLYKRKYKLVSINGPENQDKVEQYSVSSYPTLLIEKPTGSLKMYKGDRSMKDLQNFLN
jgi:thiol-disulfide isomerase/thioredoxin